MHTFTHSPLPKRVTEVAQTAALYPEGQQVIGGTASMHRAMGIFVALAIEASSADAGSLYVLDATSQTLIPYVTVGLPEDYVSLCGAIAVGDQCCGRAVLHKQQWIVSDMLIDPLFRSAKAAAERSPVRAAFSTAVIDSAGNCQGSLACHFFEPHMPSTADLTRNKLWAELIAHTVEDSRQSSMSATG